MRELLVHTGWVKVIPLALMLLLFCNGCWDKKELNQLALAQVMAVDYQDHYYTITLQLILPSAGEETITSENLWSLSGIGASVGEALQQIALEAPRELYLDHLDLVLLGEGALQHNMEQGLDYLLKENVLRRRTGLLAVQGMAGELLSGSAELAKMDIFYMDNLLNEQSRRVHGNDAIINTYYLSTYNGLQDAMAIPRIVMEQEDGKARSLRLDGVALIQNGILAAWEDRAWLPGYYWMTGGSEVITLQHNELVGLEEGAAQSDTDSTGQMTVLWQDRQVVVELQKKKCQWVLVSETPLEVRAKLRGTIKIISGYDSWKNSEEADYICARIQQRVEEKALEQIAASVQQAQTNQTDPFRLGRWLYAWHPQLVQADQWQKQFASIPITFAIETKVEL